MCKESKMWYIGIDIGSTCAKLAVLDGNRKLCYTSVQPTGWSSVDTAEQLRQKLTELGYTEGYITATGYGRISVPYANRTLTEISCHGKGAEYLFGSGDLTVIDIGGQDTKAIRLEGGMVKDFMMNDKCSAGTGRFLEIMGNNMALKPDQLCELARTGSSVRISSLCTVFAESEVISLIGRGEKRENIAHAVVESIADKVVSQSGRIYTAGDQVCLTGGLCDCTYLREMLEQKLRTKIETNSNARYAGAIGAALFSLKSSGKEKL